MSNIDRQIAAGTGYVWLGDTPVYDAISMNIVAGLNGFDATLRNGIYVIHSFQRLTLNIETATLNVNLLAKLTGGTLSTGSVKKQEETLAKSSNTLTLSQTPNDTNALVILPEAANAAPLLKVASSPAVGEFSISGTTVTLNASESATNFLCIYAYTAGSDGETLQINPTHLPTTKYKFLGYGLVEDPNTGQKGEMFFEFAKIQRALGDVTIGFQNGAQQNVPMSFNILNTVPSDIKFYNDVA